MSERGEPVEDMMSHSYETLLVELDGEICVQSQDA